MPNTFTCSICKRTFEKGLSDDEAKAELDETFGVPEEDCELVCDGCYKAMGFGS